MGYLGNDSENYVTVDTILTKRGRELLSKGDGQFKIVKFTFSDDSIDYRRFNTSTGSVAQDADILNTVVFEAFTHEDIVIKYPAISISDPTLKYLPIMKANNESLTLNEMNDAAAGKTVEFSQDTVLTGKRVPAEIVDGSFIIQMDNDLLAIDGEYPSGKYPDNTAHYVLPKTGTNSVGGAKIAFNAIVKSLPTDIFQRYGVGVAGSRTITTKIECIGVISSLNKSINVTIQEGFSRTA